MRFPLLLLALALAFAPSAAHAQAPAWTGGIQSRNATPADASAAGGQTIATDAAGNAYVGGYLAAGGGNGAPLIPATRTFGATSLSSSGSGSGFIAKISPTLEWQWALRVSTSGPNGAFLDHVAVSPAGEVYLAGYTEEETATTLSIGTFSQTLSAGNHFFIARLNTSGQVQELTLLSPPNADSYIEAQVAWDAASNALVVLGLYQGLAPGLGSTALPAASPAGAGFVARLSPAGAWSSVVPIMPTNVTTESDLKLGELAVGPQGQVAIGVGLSYGTLNLGPTTLTSSDPTNENYKIAVAQLSAAGQWQWVAQPAGVMEDFYLDELTYDRAGNAWLLGGGEMGLQLGSFTLPANTDGFVARLSSAGQWSTVSTAQRPAGSPEAGYLGELAIDASGNVVVTGEVAAGRTLTLGSLTLQGTDATIYRNFVARLGAAGQWQYAQLAPIDNSSDPYYFDDSTLDPAGNLLTTGILYNGTVMFGPSTLTGSNGGDVFVAKLRNAGAPLAARQPASAPHLALYPNPVASGAAATLLLAAPAPAALPVFLRDALGRVVRTTSLAAGQQQMSLPTADLLPGLYQLEAGISRAQVVVE